MSLFDEIDWHSVEVLYHSREKTHRQLLSLYRSHDEHAFCQLLLGISDSTGNFSAADHDLGPRILDGNSNACRRLYDVASEMLGVVDGKTIPYVIKSAHLRFFGIGVGSEASAMLNPNACWVANVRTVWTHLLMKHDGDAGLANEELHLYRQGDESSEMAYAKWKAIHRELYGSMCRIARQPERVELLPESSHPLTFIWADAIANTLYETYQT